MRAYLFAFGLAAIVTFGVLMVAAAPHASANPTDPQEKSLQSALEQFALALKAEGEKAKARLDAELEALRQALSAQKDQFGILGDDAAAAVEEWQREAARSWSELNRSAAEALDAFRAWMHQQQSQPEDAPIQV